MKQMVMLERDDLAALKRGDALTLVVGGQTVTVGYDGIRTRAAKMGTTQASAVRGARTSAHRVLAPPTECPVCHVASKDKRTLLGHLRRYHQAAYRRMTAGPHKCPKCRGVSFKKKRWLGAHLWRTHKIRGTFRKGR